MKFWPYFWTLQKHLIKFGTKDFFTKLKNVGLKEIYRNC